MFVDLSIGQNDVDSQELPGNIQEQSNVDPTVKLRLLQTLRRGIDARPCAWLVHIMTQKEQRN